MPSKGRSIVIQYVAWDTATNSGRTGDDTNHTLRTCKDGVAAAPTNTPEEIDATNAPGLYRLTLTNAEMNADSIAVAGISSTSGVVIIPVQITTELLPIISPGESGGVATADAAGRVDIGVTCPLKPSPYFERLSLHWTHSGKAVEIWPGHVIRRNRSLRSCVKRRCC